MTDLTVIDEGSACMFVPNTDTAKSWLMRKLSDAPQWMDALVVQDRCVRDVVLAACDYGLTIAFEEGSKVKH